MDSSSPEHARHRGRRFVDKVAVVTGAAQGIGAATAARLAAEGATVAVVDLSVERGADTVDQVTSAGGTGVAFGCNVADAREVEATVDAVTSRFGKIDVLVNNAGITRDNMLFRMSDDDWSAVMLVNLTSMFFMCRAVQRCMVQARYGRIVSLSSRSALGNRGQANYSAAKAGVQGLTATLAIELGPYNITANAVAPGYVATAMTAAVAERVGVTLEDHQRTAAQRTALGRVAHPDEIASVVAFLASDDASYVSGQTLYVNGGSR